MPSPFATDETHRAYDADAVNRFWRALVQADRVFKIFRGRFIGKCSPVHLFWGAMDLAVTRFSGRPAPEHPGGIPNLPDRVTREAYSHEVSSCGFWPGTAPIDYPAFYSYAYPEPAGFADGRVRPDAAFFSKDFGEFILPVRRACASRRRPTRRCWSSCSPPTSWPPISPGGIGPRWNGRSLQPEADPEGSSMPLFAPGRRWFAAGSIATIVVAALHTLGNTLATGSR